MTDDELRQICFQALLEHSLDNIYFKDRDSRFLLVSRRMAEWFGRSEPSELVGLTDADLFAPEHAREALADEQALLRGETSIVCKEERETWPDGRETWVSTVKRPLFDLQGRVMGTFGISRDITEPRRARARAEGCARQFAELVDIVNRSPAVVFEWGPGPDWSILYVSDNVIQLGCDPNWLRSQRIPYASLIHPEDIQGVRENMEAVLAAGQEHYELIYRLVPPDGRVRHLEELGVVRRDAEGHVLGFQGLVLDVTRRHQAEAELQRYRERLEQMVEERTRDLRIVNERLQQENARRQRSETALAESEQRYRRLLETVTDYVYTVEVLNGRPVATHHGPGCRAVTGYEPTEYDANPFLWFEMIVPEDRPLVLEQARRVLSDGVAPPVEHRLVRKDGTVRWVRSSVSPRRDPEGRILGYDGLVKDITESRQEREARIRAEIDAMEARQREAMERADRLSSLGLLAAGVAHEINNPLQGMLGHLDAVRRALPPDFPRTRNLKMVERGIESIAGLVQRLLWVGGPGDRDEGACALADAIAYVTELLSAQFQRRNVMIAVEARALHVQIAVPRREVIQVLMNLLMNARDAMPEGGTVRIETDVDGEVLVLTVSDTGPGIPADVLPRLFTPFFTTKGPKGTGLGLSVVEAIVRNRGGTVVARNAPEGGAVFEIRLPLTHPARQGEAR